MALAFAPPEPPRRRASRRGLALAVALGVHALVIAALWLGRAPAAMTPEAPVDLQIAPPPFTPPARVDAHRAGGSPASAARHARATSPAPKTAIVPPDKVRPPAPVDPLPTPAPTLIAPVLPTLASPVTGAGAGAATGGNGAGTGTGRGGPGGPALAETDWTAFAGADAITAHYPRRALEAGMPGAVVLRCRGTADGRARDCRVKSETPRSEGFGRAALELSPLFRFRPRKVDGRPVEVTLEIPIDFAVDADEDEG